jgi:hypothetical protein
MKIPIITATELASLVRSGLVQMPDPVAAEMRGRKIVKEPAKEPNMAQRGELVRVARQIAEGKFPIGNLQRIATMYRLNHDSLRSEISAQRRILKSGK